MRCSSTHVKVLQDNVTRKISGTKSLWENQSFNQFKSRSTWYCVFLDIKFCRFTWNPDSWLYIIFFVQFLWYIVKVTKGQIWLQTRHESFLKKRSFYLLGYLLEFIVKIWFHCLLNKRLVEDLSKLQRKKKLIKLELRHCYLTRSVDTKCLWSVEWSSLAIGMPRAMQSMFQYLNMIISIQYMFLNLESFFYALGMYARWDSKVSHLGINPLPQTHKIIKTIFTLNWVQSQTKSYMKLIVYNKYMQDFTSFFMKTTNYFFKIK